MKKILLTLLVIASISMLFANGAQEVAYPTKPIDLVCAGSAGSGGDTMTRVIAMYLGRELGVTVNVINTAGGGGIPAVQSVLDAAPDGYMLVADQGLSSSFQLAMDPGAVPYDIMKDRKFICKVSSGPQVLCGSTKMGWNDISDVGKYLKEGNYKDFFWGGIGANSAANFAVLEFCQAYDIDRQKMTEIRYKGGGDILAAIAGGHIMIGSCAASGVPSYVQDNMVKPLVICGASRLDILPGVPCAADLGLNNLTADFWIGISGRADLPAKVVTTINEAVKKVIANKDFLAALGRIGGVVNYIGPEEMPAAIEKEGATVAELVAMGK